MDTDDGFPAHAPFGLLIALSLLLGSTAQADEARWSAREIEREAVAGAQRLLPQPPAGATQHVIAGPLDARLSVAACAERPVVQLIASEAGTRLAARASLRLECRGPQRWTLHLPVRIESELEVLRLRQPLARGTRPLAEDLEPLRLRVPGASVDYVTALSQIEGHHLRRSLPVGAVLARGDLAREALVRRGAQVEILARLASIEVRSSGRALADAGSGERVRVLNESSQRLVEGIVEGENRVRVGGR